MVTNFMMKKIPGNPGLIFISFLKFISPVTIQFQSNQQTIKYSRRYRQNLWEYLDNFNYSICK